MGGLFSAMVQARLARQQADAEAASYQEIENRRLMLAALNAEWLMVKNGIKKPGRVYIPSIRREGFYPSHKTTLAELMRLPQIN